MIDEIPFLKAIFAYPDEDSPRLIYADWLEERGETDRAELIRRGMDNENGTLDDVRRLVFLGITVGARLKGQAGGSGNIQTKIAKGFVSGAHCSPHDWLERGVGVCLTRPIHVLNLHAGDYLNKQRLNCQGVVKYGDGSVITMTLRDANRFSQPHLIKYGVTESRSVSGQGFIRYLWDDLTLHDSVDSAIIAYNRRALLWARKYADNQRRNWTDEDWRKLCWCRDDDRLNPGYGNQADLQINEVVKVSLSGLGDEYAQVKQVLTDGCLVAVVDPNPADREGMVHLVSVVAPYPMGSRFELYLPKWCLTRMKYDPARGWMVDSRGVLTNS